LQVTSLYRASVGSIITIGHGRRRGSGFVVGPDRVAVLRRSLGGERAFRIALDGSDHSATLIAEDPGSGLAIVEAPTGSGPVVRFAAAPAEVGQAVVALGDPGTGLRATEGRISAAPLAIRSVTGRSLEALEHTAPLPRGTGGGPLLDGEGALVGVNVVRGDPGFIIAIASTVAQLSIEQMLSGAPPRSRLGVALAPPAVAVRLRRAVGLPDRDGLLVRDVEDGSAADAAGVRAGDLLVRLGDADLREIEHVHDALASAGPTASLQLIRGTEDLTLELSLTPQSV